MSGYYKLKPSLEAIFALFPLAQDVELTTFDGEGRDTTLKGYAGDVLVLSDDGGESWSIHGVMRTEDADEIFEPLGD